MDYASHAGENGKKEIERFVDDILILCFRYDPCFCYELYIAAAIPTLPCHLVSG